METTLLYSITRGDQKIYVLGALDSVVGNYSLSRPAEWENYVNDVFDAVNPSEIITPFSLQDCYDQYDGERVPSAGLNAYNLSSPSTASIVLRKAIANSSYAFEEENKPYTFKGMMTRPFYYTYCFAPVVSKIFNIKNMLSANIVPDAPAVKTLLTKYFGAAVFDNAFSSKAAYYRAIATTLFTPPKMGLNLFTRKSVILTPFNFLIEFVSNLGAILLAAEFSKWLLPYFMSADPNSLRGIYSAFSHFLATAMGMNLLNQFVGNMATELFSAAASMWKNATNRAAPLVRETLSVSKQFFDNAAYMFSESFYGRVFIVSATREYLFAENPETFDTPTLLSYLPIPQAVVAKISNFLGYSTTLAHPLEPINIETSANKLAIVPVSILAGKDGVVTNTLEGIIVKPCLLLSIPATEEHPERKEVREFNDTAELQDYLALHHPR